MSSKKKTAKKGKKGGGNKLGAEVEELRQMVEALKKEIDAMNKTIKKQSKRISGLETENKRIKKNIQKIQLNSGDGNQLYPPTQSISNATDIEQSDIENASKSDNHDRESKDDDDSKENEKIKTPRSKRQAKPVVRRNKQPPKKKAEDIKFTFDLNHQKIKAVENGSAALKPKTFAGTIRFGRFLNFKKNNTNNIASYKITFDTRSIGQNASIALGFATKSFNQWVGSNFGQNNCCIIKGNGQFLFTDKVYKYVDGKEYKHKTVIDGLVDQQNKSNGFFKAGDDVTIVVDLKNCIGKIWNDSSNKDGSDNDKVLEVILPDDYEVCVVVYMGGSAKKRLLVKDQQFVFDEQ